MSELHLAYLNLGSNIQPEVNLPKAVELLSTFGEIQKISKVWESEAVGADGPNYLNVCLLFQSNFTYAELKDKVIYLIETRLGRKRSEDKFAPRTIDIDIVLFDDKPINNDHWTLPFIIVPLADIYPEFIILPGEESVSAMATRLRHKVWMETRHGVLTQLR